MSRECAHEERRNEEAASVSSAQKNIDAGPLGVPLRIGDDAEVDTRRPA